MSFKLAPEIKESSIHLCDLEMSQLRIVMDGEIDWFLIIPKLPNIVEWYDMNLTQQLILNKEINYVCRVLKENSKFKKLNIATLGNMVSQFHLHIISRNENDRAWPGAIWGTNCKEEFKTEKSDRWIKLISSNKYQSS